MIDPKLTETPALGSARPVLRTAQPTPAEDRWDDAVDMAKSAQPTDPSMPTSAGRPGVAPAREQRRGATQVMGSNDVFESASGEETLALGPRITGERTTNDIRESPSSGERHIPTGEGERPAAAGVPGAAPRARANATIVGSAPMAVPRNDVSHESLAQSESSTPARALESAPEVSTATPAKMPATTSDASVAVPAAASAPSARAPVSRPVAVSHPVADSSASTTAQRPVLASDMLRDDLVPREPASAALRTVLAIAGVALLAFAALSYSDPPLALSWAIPGLTAVAVVLAPTTYGTRALLAFAPASAALLMQSFAMPGARVPAALAFALTVGGLPSALFFRSFFRASRRARAFVAVALVCALVWLQLPGGGALYESGIGSWGSAHAAALALIGVSFLSLLAFVGADTTAGCRAWATLAIAWAGFATFAQRFAQDHASRGLDRETLVAALGTSALAAITALCGAALLAVYARPTEPRTGIGAAASQH